jgi:hypothetical protein
MIEGREENVDARLEEQAQVLHDGLRAAFFALHEEEAEVAVVVAEAAHGGAITVGETESEVAAAKAVDVTGDVATAADAMDETKNE